MSLIFVKKDMFENICIVSDTRLNHEVSRKLPAYSDYQKNGGLKLFLVNNNKVAIAFAGCSIEAQEAFDQIEVNSFSISQTLEVLSSSSFAKNTDYLVCDAVEKAIYKISEAQVSTPNFAYIGDFDGYQLLTKNIQHSSGLDELESAMNIVIDNSKIKTVGGYCISSITSDGEFRYIQKHAFSQFKGRIEISDTPTQLSMISNSKNDTYSYVWTGDKHGFAFYFYEAKLGLIYTPLKIKPVEVLTAIRFHEFDEKLKKYNLKLPVKIGSVSSEEEIIDFSYDLYRSGQYQRCIDKITPLGSKLNDHLQVYFQANYLLGCCYKELGIAAERQSSKESYELLEKAVKHFILLINDYKPDYSVQTNMAIAYYSLGHVTEDLVAKKTCFHGAVNCNTNAVNLDCKQVLPYHNRASANYQLLRFCRNSDERNRAIQSIVSDCERVFSLDPKHQISISLKMHVLSMRV
ncbi:hypothetical protein [Aliivibrio fischeri]|uniref:hypothetical protein n=1 Tax=Aliivibrio fischeri TaxID=668 RepID=UPI00080DFA0B|nr:hypothetical protein [Aliivibrio fischeri]OCH11345.1 hypothetical protein A6E11_05695 [Aliivibrio fischeri]